MKRSITFLMILMLMTGMVMTGCGKEMPKKDPNQLQIVATDFAPYDFAKRVAGDAAQVTMLLSPGEEAHSFEPTPREIIQIQECDVFVYTGGESEEWVTDILEDLGSDITAVKLMDCVELFEEETVEGMESDGHGHSHDEEECEEEGHDHEHEDEHDHGEGAEYDEHVWTAPANAILITEYLSDVFAQADPEQKEAYEANEASYVKELEKLDQAFWKVVKEGKRKTLIFGDRFPMRYFVEEYGLAYYAAFPGCASDTEPSAKTVAFLIDKVRDEHIPVVFHVELSNQSMVNTICEDTGAKKCQINACHNISKEQFEAGVGYLELMWHNVEVLKEALN